MEVRRPLVAAALAVLVAVAAACGGGNGGGEPGAGDTAKRSITVWILENEPDRIAATKANLAILARATGIQVRLVGVGDDEFAGRVSRARPGGAAARRHAAPARPGPRLRARGDARHQARPATSCAAWASRPSRRPPCGS
jgi:maltose-binding protein MalE